ncbi:MAG: archease [Candidatus Aenigmarchaeota archaeon]|nr:archease [Candidatus Aenigmarchaeota archaeon]
MKYRYLPHTADAKIEAFGKDLNELFKNAALATYNIMVETQKVEPLKEIEIKLNSESIESLLYDWIEELLFYLDTEKFLINNTEVKIKKSGENNISLKATLKGDRISKKYELGGSVKSMTYNCLIIEKTKDGFRTIFVVDR